MHDVKNQLYVINMGLEVLRGSLDDPNEILKLVNSIRADGLEPLKASITRLIEAASQNAPSPAETAPDDME